VRNVILYKIVPQNASGIFKNTDKDGNFSRFVFNRGAGMGFLDAEKLAKFAEPGETPVAFFGDEAMVRIYEDG
jgi:hypothetical protein